MIHDYGPGSRFASAHVEMDYREDVLDAHERIDELERAGAKRRSAWSWSFTMTRL